MCACDSCESVTAHCFCCDWCLARDNNLAEHQIEAVEETTDPTTPCIMPPPTAPAFKIPCVKKLHEMPSGVFAHMIQSGQLGIEPPPMSSIATPPPAPSVEAPNIFTVFSIPAEE
ncbi:hypothetical protein PR048_012915 [Dryococelus australis]|uniref:Uncharacterized protein n=1 Tax=Dryococelus australis TaxID=614101 RepID=A0ABQ9HS64_9NEOP|nr:hypothetical protein PR048_012915 [Dryococelus australis]